MSGIPPRAVRLLLIALAAYAYGRVSAELPAPSDPSRFWLGNFGAPYLLLPFLAGAWRFGLVGSMVAGGLAGASLIAGFYDVIAVAGNTSMMMDLPLDTPEPTRIATAYGRWLSTFILGQPGGIPWLTIAIGCGALLGLVGRHWQTSGSRLAAAVPVMPFLAEPLVYVLHLETRVFPADGYAIDPLNVAMWLAEALVGVGLWLALTRRRPPPDDDSVIAGPTTPAST